MYCTLTTVRFWVATLLFAISGLLTPVGALANSTYDHALPATVYVQTLSALDPSQVHGSGSGVLVSASPPRVLTNFHVVKGRDETRIFFPAHDPKGKLITDREYYDSHHEELGIRGRVVARDAARDLALIELDRNPGLRLPVPLASQGATHSDIVYKIGNSPLEQGKMWGFMGGQVIDVAQRKIKYENGQLLDTLILKVRVGALPGDSGGPLLNDNGELVGLVTGYNELAPSCHNSIELAEIKAFLAERMPKEPTGISSNPFVWPDNLGSNNPHQLQLP